MKIFENYKFWYSFYFKLDKLFECELPWKLFAETVLHILKSQFSAFWKQLSKKITHICRRWGTPQNFLSAFNDELWKTEKSEFWKNEKNPQPYEVQFLRYGVRQNIFVILGRFLPFYHPPPPPPPQTTQKTKILKKMEKSSGDVIILNLCNKKNDHMMRANSDTECDRNNFLSF